MGSASRNALIEFAEKNQIPIAKDKRGEAPFSTDANLLHISSEGKVLEDPALEVPGLCLFASFGPGGRAGQADHRRDHVRKGRPIAIDGKKLSPRRLLAASTSLATTMASGGSILSRIALSA